MTSPESVVAQPAAAVSPLFATPRAPWSWLAFVALGLAALETAALLLVRTIAASIAYTDNDTVNVATVFGVLGLLSIVLTAGVIVLGHLAVWQTKNDLRRGRALAGAALGAGYFHLLLFGNRIILAAIAASSMQDFSTFLANIFYWA